MTIINPQDQLHNFLKAGVKPLFPSFYLEKMKSLDTGFCLPGSIKVDTLIIPVIAIHVHPSGLGYFGIGKKPPEEMNHRFRYLDNKDKDEVVQICLYMKEKRQLALNLDPSSNTTRHYLGDILKVKLFGFIFFCISKKVFMTSFTAPDTVEYGWLERNSKRAKRLHRNNFRRILMDSMSADELTGIVDKKYYLAEQDIAGNYFFDAKSIAVPLDRVSEYLY